MMDAPRPTRKPVAFFPKDPLSRIGQDPSSQFGRKSLLRPQARSRAGSATGSRATTVTTNAAAPPPPGCRVSADLQRDSKDGADDLYFATGFRTAAASATGHPPRAPADLHWDSNDGVDDLVNDALDDLIFGAAKTLDELKKMRDQASKGLRQPKPVASRSLGNYPKSKSFWNPKADSDLWTLSDERALKWSDDGFTGLSDSSGDDEGSDSDDDPWDGLAQALGFGSGRKPGFASSSSESSPSGAHFDPAANRNHEEAKRMQGPAGAARSASNACKPGQRSRPERHFVGPRAKPQQPRQSQQPSTGPTSSGASERARAGGFQFGSEAKNHHQASASPSVEVAAAAEEAATAAAQAAEAVATAAMDGTMAECTLEIQLTTCLNAAKAGGPKVLRKILKRLVLQWHPDKCHDGGEKLKALRTRAFQHLMKEKDRLGL